MTCKFTFDFKQATELRSILAEHKDILGVDSRIGPFDFPPYSECTLILAGSDEENKQMFDRIKDNIQTNLK